jgi:hypothetical protein
MFEGEGAVGIIRTTLAPHLGGTPVPEGLTPAEVKTFAAALTDKVGLKPLSPILTIYDDPTAKVGAGKALSAAIASATRRARAEGRGRQGRHLKRC